MSDTDNWLARYEQTHTNLRNGVVYWTAVPMVVIGTVGLLWSLPVPAEFFKISPLLNWGSTFLMVTAVYYFLISVPLAIGLLPFLVGIASIHLWLPGSPLPAFGVSASLVLAGIVGLALGRAGRIRSVMLDLQLMMIGPAWLLSLMYRRFGIPL
jgi:uncharacterized membrane protein YGL010W